jgi:hypothetical protein
MRTTDFFRARRDGMVDPRHPLVVLTNRLPWTQFGQVQAPHFERRARTPGTGTGEDMLGEHEVERTNPLGRRQTRTRSSRCRTEPTRSKNSGIDNPFWY